MPALPPVLLTGRFVRLEPLSPAHAEGLWAAASGARETFALATVPDSPAAMQAAVAAALALQESGAALPFATVDAAAGKVVGATRFMNVERWPWPPGHPEQRPQDGPEARPDAVEIGSTWLAPGAQRTAINSEAKLLMLTHAFETWRCHRVTLKTDARNARSRAAIERLGAKLDGLVRAHMPAADGLIRDTALYSIVRVEWPACKARLHARLFEAQAPDLR
jgi:RimJ/RimL family protein N-acetyltransferase